MVKLGEESLSIMRKNKRIIWIGLGAIVLSHFFIAVLFKYVDTVVINTWCYNFWNALFTGNIGDYYNYCFEKGVVVDSIWVSFFPWILWTLPMYIINRHTGDVSGLECVLYSKFFLYICLVITCIFIYKIIVSFKEADSQDALISVLMIAGSLEIIDSVGYAGQDEIVYLMWYVIGLYCCVKNRHLLSLLFYTFTVTACPILIVPILCQLMVFQKNILKVFIYAAIMMMPLGIFEFLYRNDELYHSLKQHNTLGIFQEMMNTGTVSTSIGKVSIAFTIIVIVAILAYIFNGKPEEKNRKTIIYGSIVFFCLTAISSTSFYRFCIYLPIFAILLGISKSSFDFKVFLISFVSVLRFIYSLAMGYNFEYRFASELSLRLFGQKLVNHGDLCIIDRFSIPFDSALYMIRPMIMGMTIFFLYLCCKDKEVTFPINHKYTTLVYSFSGLLLVLFVIFKFWHLS